MPPASLASCARALVVLALSVLLAVYLWRAVRKYRDGRVGVTVREEFLRTSAFPAAAVCAEVGSFRPVSALRSWVAWVGHDYAEERGRNGTSHYRMLAYRNGTVLNRPRVSTGGGGGSFFRDYLVMTRHPSDTVFLCNVYVPPEGLRTPHTVYHDMTLHLKLPHQRSHLLYLHIGHPDVMTIGGSFLGNSGTIITFDEVDSRIQYSTRISIKFGEHVSLSKEERPCLSDEEASALHRRGQGIDFMKCFADYITGKVPCYAGGLGNASAPCDEGDVGRISGHTEDLMQDGELSMLGKVGCAPPCRLPTYEIKSKTVVEEELEGLEEEEEEEEEVETDYVELALDAVSSSRIIKEEYVVYDLESLAGDAGGIMGMLLGASALAMYDSVLQTGLRFILGRLIGGRGSEQKSARVV